MIDKQRIAIGAGLIGVGGSLLSLGASEVEEKFRSLGLPTGLSSAGIYFGAFLLAMGVAFIVVSVELPGRSIVRYEFRRIRRNELRPLLRFARRLLGQAPSLNQVKDLYNTNPNAIWVAERVKEHSASGITSTKVVGFFTIVPLTDKAMRLVEEERLDGLHFTSEHIAGPKQKPAALYLGSVAAKGFQARAEILAYVRGRIEDEVERGSGIVYTRPISRDGLRLATKYSFLPVAENSASNELGRIYKKTYETYSDVHPDDNTTVEKPRNT
jgi:hypothetical protein